MAAPTITELVAPIVSHLWGFVAGCAVAILVGFAVAKSVRVKSRAARRAMFSAVAFLGFCISWYIAFGRAGR
jgi:cell division protein FtsW (lipid II flippase)